MSIHIFVLEWSVCLNFDVDLPVPSYHDCFFESLIYWEICFLETLSRTTISAMVFLLISYFDVPYFVTGFTLKFRECLVFMEFIHVNNSFHYDENNVWSICYLSGLVILSVASYPSWPLLLYGFRFPTK